MGEGENMYTSAFINRNFRIKVFGMVGGKKLNTLVGVSGLLELLNGDTAKIDKYITRSLKSMQDKTCCKIYGGATITFYVK